MVRATLSGIAEPGVCIDDQWQSDNLAHGADVAGKFGHRDQADIRHAQKCVGDAGAGDINCLEAESSIMRAVRAFAAPGSSTGSRLLNHFAQVADCSFYHLRFFHCRSIRRRLRTSLSFWVCAPNLTASDCQHLSRFGRRGDVITSRVSMILAALSTSAALLGVSLPLLQIEIVLQPDPHVSAEQHGLRRNRELVQRNAECEPDAVGRQQVAHVGDRLRGGRLAPGNPEADLEQAGRLDVSGLDQPLGEQEVTGLEHFELRRDAGVADCHRHCLEVGRRVDEDLAAHVHAAHVEAADFGPELDHMAHALGRQCASVLPGPGLSGSSTPGRNARRARW